MVLFKTAALRVRQVTEEQLPEGVTMVCESDSFGSKLDTVNTINVDSVLVLLQALRPVLLEAETELDEIGIIQLVKDQDRPFDVVAFLGAFLGVIVAQQRVTLEHLLLAGHLSYDQIVVRHVLFLSEVCFHGAR